MYNCCTQFVKIKKKNTSKDSIYTKKKFGANKAIMNSYGAKSVWVKIHFQIQPSCFFHILSTFLSYECCFNLRNETRFFYILKH